MNGLSILGVALNVVFAIICKASGQYDLLSAFLLAAAALSTLGVILVAMGQRKAGAITVLVGSVVFVPLGLLAAIGARKTLDELAKEEFEALRAQRAKVRG